MRELRLAQTLDPNAGHAELLDLYAHIGLEEQTERELNLAARLDPNDEEVKIFYINALMIAGNRMKP